MMGARYLVHSGSGINPTILSNNFINHQPLFIEPNPHSTQTRLTIPIITPEQLLLIIPPPTPFINHITIIILTLITLLTIIIPTPTTATTTPTTPTTTQITPTTLPTTPTPPKSQSQSPMTISLT